jgi:hypothetical protein
MRSMTDVIILCLTREFGEKTTGTPKTKRATKTKRTTRGAK